MSSTLAKKSAPKAADDGKSVSLGSTTDHGGRIVLGCPRVLIS